MREYIHYGSTEFRKELFMPIKNRENFVKPSGGLWSSPITRKSPKGEWKEWVDGEGFSNGFKERYGDDNFFKFQLKRGSKILTIRSAKELRGLPQIKSEYYDFGNVLLDFEELAKEYDGIEVLISEEDKRGLELGEGLYWELYGWDCDSLLVFNKDIVEVLE